MQSRPPRAGPMSWGHNWLAASGLRDLARFMDSVDLSLAASYRAATLTILAALRTDRHIAWNEPGGRAF